MENVYLLIEGCPGTSTIKKDAIEINSFSWGVSNSGASAKASGETRSGRPDFQPMQIAKKVDPTTPKLLKHCYTCDPFDKATLGFMKQLGAANVEYILIELKKVFIGDVHVSPGGNEPMESISLAYEEVEFIYKPEAPDKKSLAGQLTAKYSVVQNKPLN
jgi:type VI secretion system secreted protein Hcp